MTEAVIPSIQAQSTPIRPAGQSLISTRVDTEGRRSRFHSPPPPPGASPSLLLPTPGRVADNASLFGDLSQDNESIDMIHSTMSPIMPPVFELKESKSSIDDDGRTGEKVTRLYRWHLRLVRSNTNPSSDPNLTHWVIAVGKPKNGASADSVKTQSWRSSVMHKRRTATSFETSSGSVYELVGPCNIKATAKATSTEFAAYFQDGLPESWMDIVAKEACRLQYVRPSEAANSILPVWPSDDDIPVKRLVKKRKMVASSGLDIVPLSRRTSDASIQLPASPIHSRKKPRTSQMGIGATTPKGISREVRQLQSSKLGKLALVEAAIMEGLDTPERQLSGKVKKTKSRAGKEEETGETASSGHKGEFAGPDIRQPAKTPLRSSNRARNSVREWWKVSSESEKKKTVQGTPSMADPSPKSPGTHLGLATDESDSEEEYKCVPSSEEEETSREVEVKIAPKKYARKGRISAVPKSTGRDKASVEPEPDSMPTQTPEGEADPKAESASAPEEGEEDRSAEALDLLQMYKPVMLPVLARDKDTIAEEELPLAANEEAQESNSEGETLAPVMETEVSNEEQMPFTLSLEEEADIEENMQEGLPDIFEAALETQEAVESEATTPSQTIETSQGDKVDELRKMLPDVLLIGDTDDENDDDVNEALFYFSD
jgi:hypothetical protein